MEAFEKTDEKDWIVDTPPARRWRALAGTALLVLSGVCQAADAPAVDITRIGATTQDGDTNPGVAFNDALIAIPKLCFKNLPAPRLVFAGREDYTANDKEWTRYRLRMENAEVFPPMLFKPAPDLPACGANTDSARTWVDIYNDQEQRIYGFCALSSPEQLNNIWFAVPRGEKPPAAVHVVLHDRRCGLDYKSNPVLLRESITIDCDNQDVDITGILSNIEPGTSVRLSGICKLDRGLTIEENGITLDGGGTAVIDARQSEGDAALRISGVHGVTLTGFALFNAPQNAIVVDKRASVVMDDLKIVNAKKTGLLITDRARVVFTDPRSAVGGFDECAGGGSQPEVPAVGVTATRALTSTQPLATAARAASLPQACEIDIDDIDGDGVHVDGGSLSLKNCEARITNTEGDGLKLTGNSTLFGSNTEVRLKSNKSGGFILSDSNATFFDESKLLASDNAEGMHLSGGSNIVLFGNSAVESTNNTGHGLFVGTNASDSDGLVCWPDTGSTLKVSGNQPDFGGINSHKVQCSDAITGP